MVHVVDFTTVILTQMNELLIIILHKFLFHPKYTSQ
jgi:hypothetical protein